MAKTTDALAEAQRLVDGVLDGAYRVEFVGRSLVVTPAAGLPHNLVAGDLLVWLRGRVPAPWLVVHEVDVSTDSTGAGREPYWRPDLVVTSGSADPTREWLLADEVLAVVEVVSPSNREAGSGERYVQGRADHSTSYGIEWLLAVDGDEVTWWRRGRRVASGPEWAAGLSVEGGRVVTDR